MNIQEDELKNLILDGKIDIKHIQDMVSEENMKRSYLDKHNYEIWQAPDGRWCTYFDTVDGKKKIKRRVSKNKLIKDICDHYYQIEEDPTVEEVFHMWNDRRYSLNQISNPTYNRYRVDFKRHCKPIAKRKISKMDDTDFIEFLENEIHDKQLTAKSFANLRQLIRGILRYARRKKWLNCTVEDVINGLAVGDKAFRKVIKEDDEEVFDEDEFDRIISYLTAHLDYLNLGILLMFATGIRVGELVALKHSDFSDNSFIIRRTESRNIEGNKIIYVVKDYPKTKAGVRTVVVPSEFQWLLKEIKKLNPFMEYVFYTRNKNRSHADQFRKRLYRICDKLGIRRKSPHKIRKTYGTILLDNNIDHSLIMEQMGHADVLVTEKHYHRNRKTIDKKQDILSKIPDFYNYHTG